LPAGLTGVGGRVLRNGCDRIAAGLYNPALAVSNSNIPTRCFPENYLVANPQLGTPTLLANTADSNYHSLQTQFNVRPIQGVSWQTTYTWSKLLADMPGGWTDPLNRRADYTLPFEDVRHDLRTNGTLELPIGPNKLLFKSSSGLVARLIERWQTSLILNWASGNPRTIAAAHTRYAGGSNTIDNGQNKAMIASPLFNPSLKGHAEWNGPIAPGHPGPDTGTYWGTNWVMVQDPQCQVTNKTDSMGFNLYANGSCTLRAAAYKNPDGTSTIMLDNPFPGQYGNMPLSLQTVGKWRFDMNLSKTFRLAETKSLQFRMDATNVLNHPDLTEIEPGVVQTMNDAGREFGRITSKQGFGSGAGSRAFNASLRLTF
jgi:hypothetical protein